MGDLPIVMGLNTGFKSFSSVKSKEYPFKMIFLTGPVVL